MADRHLEVNEKHTMMYELHDKDGKVKGCRPWQRSYRCQHMLLCLRGECPRVRCRCGRGDGVQFACWSLLGLNQGLRGVWVKGTDLLCSMLHYLSSYVRGNVFVFRKCKRLCIHTHTHTLIYVCIYVSTSIYKYGLMDILIFGCVSVCTYVCLYVCM